GLLVAPSLARAQVPGPPDIPASPGVDPAAPDLSDPGFDRYVDLRLVGDAWRQMDPALLTDVALQLAEGERALKRPHRSLPCAKLLETAARLAADKNDKPSLERLAKAASLYANQALAGQVAASLKLASEARAVDPAAVVSVETTTPETFARYR